MIRIRYEAEGGHVKCRVFTGISVNSMAQSGTLTIRLEDWESFKRQLESTSPPVTFKPEREASPWPAENNR
jgi:hypothetical protein